MKDIVEKYRVEKQIEKTEYLFSNYVNEKRWNSYWHQIDEVIQLKAKSLLIIGSADNIVRKILSEYLSDIRTVDIDPELYPDYLISVSDLDSVCVDKFEVILCCQVLEHLPFDLFEKSILQLSQVCSGFCILSLPQMYYRFRMSLYIQTHELYYQYIYNRKNIDYKFNGEHYWEIGVENCSLKEIEIIIKKYFNIERTYVVKNNPYHRFFVLKKIS